MVGFLGDPKFPDKAMNSKRGLKIVYFQHLYKQYSQLNFTRMDDRPFGIEGLENRLRAAYKTKGGYGIFDDGRGNGLFHRSLLWQRVEASPGAPTPWLSRIPFSPERNIFVPSWSWMAYTGGIDYLAPQFDKTDWETRDIQPPWSTAGAGALSPDGTKLMLAVTARSFTIEGSPPPTQSKLLYDADRQGCEDRQSVRCVVVARSKQSEADAERRHYVLFIQQVNRTSSDGRPIFERVGAGFMPGKFITRDEPGIQGLVE